MPSRAARRVICADWSLVDHGQQIAVVPRCPRALEQFAVEPSGEAPPATVLGNDDSVDMDEAAIRLLVFRR